MIPLPRRPQLKAFVLLAALLLFVADQLTKWVVAHTMDLHESIPILGRGLALTYIRNTGGAFGLLPGGGLVFVVTGVLVLAGLLWALARMERWGWLTASACALILGGTLGNLVDRMRFGAVIDFIDLKVWPIFNVADMGISVGIGLLVWQLLFRPQRPAAAAGEPGPGSGRAGAGAAEEPAYAAGGPALASGERPGPPPVQGQDPAACEDSA